ncbi:transcriptional regulator, IclR family [Streptomyces sp. cf386]|uniref:IclR family transcriptional regulator domain-containing protein n=1 Tax=Streptomyces sp. cf386 TaxID=1761904 RepID=UPI00088042D8|nr:IclR family transcriptional regulator C-terminal domain-containing protein [Streptomyces sp. cf386]SDP54159.1 transcriptional regulator, IclR family [Streptomyces sp. cf386]
MNDNELGRYFVQSLERGIAVIRAFSADTPEMTLAEIAKATTMSRATARRFVLTLADLGYMAVAADGRHFRLTPRVLELGYAYLSSLSLAEIALPHLEQLVAEVHESSSVAVLDGDDVVYVSRVPTRRIMSVSISIGTRLPAHATSLGRVLLAHLDDARLRTYVDKVFLRPLTGRTITSREALLAELHKVRAQGWCLVDQELEEGLISIGAPIRSEAGQVVAGVNLSTHVRRGDAVSVRRTLLPPLLATAARIEAELHVVG